MPRRTQKARRIGSATGVCLTGSPSRNPQPSSKYGFCVFRCQPADAFASISAKV